MAKTKETIDLTPTPRVYLALTHTALTPLDALCELIDNSIDSFRAAELKGQPKEHPLIIIKLPTKREIENEQGSILIQDNGPGLSLEMVEKALKAGFSGNAEAYDTLGLFGMGFNISTGKLGQETRFYTADNNAYKPIEAIINLKKFALADSFKVPVQRKYRVKGFHNGTIVEVSKWWPEGGPNHNFALKLVRSGIPKIRREIGRRYSTILKERGIRIFINDEQCEPFYHCSWDDSRFIEHGSRGQIQAVYHFNETIGIQKRCISCMGLIRENEEICSICGTSGMQTIEERIKGWVGIQRFDDENNFGIDLIRNGRAIRVSEKSAFFEYTDEYKTVTKDYPMDNPYGRIIGEVHLDHVPVDFLKQDFQRTSIEWQKAISFLRGDSSLKPTQPGAEDNLSYVFKLYQGYRRVRGAGKRVLYMGYWNPDKEGPDRISREVEKEYYRKFLNKEPGYFDDSEWYKLVEQADTRPPEELVTCPNPECNAENLVGHDACQICGYVLIGKKCVNSDCEVEIPISILACPHCGKNQEPESIVPWICLVCQTQNEAISESCTECGNPQATKHPLSKEYLIVTSEKSDELSYPGCTVTLADGNHSTPIDVVAYVTKGPITKYDERKKIPAVTFKSEKIEIFLDLQHPMFRSYRIYPEFVVSAEAALYIFDANRSLTGQQYERLHSLPNLQWAIINARWSDKLENTPERLIEEINSFFEVVKEKLPIALKEQAEDLFQELNDNAILKLTENIISQGHDISDIAEMKKSGVYLRYIDEDTIIFLFNRNTKNFFDDNVWSVSYGDIADMPETVATEIREKYKSQYRNCLEDIVNFSHISTQDPTVMRRTSASLHLLKRDLV